MIKEATITKKLIEAMKKSFGLGIWIKKRHQSAYSAGEPDIAGVLNGRPFFIEVKRIDGKLSPLQADTMNKLSRAGAYVGLYVWIKLNGKCKFILIDDLTERDYDWSRFVGKVWNINVTSFVHQELDGAAITARIERFYK